MDQHLADQASTQKQKATEGNSSDAAVSSSTDTTATHGSGCFNFFALPRELRDMIYDQFQRLHPDTPRVREGRPVFMTSQSVTTKPITPLLLVNKRMGSEYKNSCKKRLGVIVSSSMDNLAPGAEFEEEIYPWDAEKASFIHMHAGDWMYRHRLDDPEWTLSPLKDWLARQDLRMPNLDSITVRIYLSLGSLKSLGGRKKLEDALQDFVSVPKLSELKIITMDDVLDWRWSERGANSKKLLVHWTPSRAHRLALINSPHPYVETCCKCLGVLPSDFGDSSSDSDNSNGNGDADGDQGNESNDGDNSENNDDDNDAGNGFHGNADNDDKEYEENAEEDANEISDEMSPGGADTTSGAEDIQAPSYFNFFGLPPEIRDMIYDQPEMLDQEIRLCHHDYLLDLDYPSSRFAATKPRTSLLMVNSQFSSEYEKRCEGRSGLFIAGPMDQLEITWKDGLQIPPKAAAKSSFLHIHIGDGIDPGDFVLYRDMRPFKHGLSRCASRMPKLESISVNIYIGWDYVLDVDMRRDFVKHLNHLTSVNQLTELRVVVMDDPYQWRLKEAEKSILVDWKRAVDVSVQVMDHAVKYEGDCCIGSLASETVGDEGKEHSEDAYHNHNHDSDDSEEGDEEMRLFWDVSGD